MFVSRQLSSFAGRTMANVSSCNNLSSNFYLFLLILILVITCFLITDKYVSTFFINALKKLIPLGYAFYFNAEMSDKYLYLACRKRFRNKYICPICDLKQQKNCEQIVKIQFYCCALNFFFFFYMRDHVFYHYSGLLLIATLSFE